MRKGNTTKKTKKNSIHKNGVRFKILKCLMLLFCITSFAFATVSGIKFKDMADDKSPLGAGVTSIRGDSMLPTVKDNQKMYTKPASLERGEIVAVISPGTDEYPSFKGTTMIKRIVAIPGDVLEITESGIVVNGELVDESEYTDSQENTLTDETVFEELVLSQNQYFVLGDNRKESFDSRHVGPVNGYDVLYAMTLQPNDYTQELKAEKTEAQCVFYLCAACGIGFFSGFVYMMKKPDKKKLTIAQKEAAKEEKAQKSQNAPSKR